MKTFKFSPEVEPHVRALTELMMYANNCGRGQWARQCGYPEMNGPYGHASCCIDAIIREEAPADAKDWAEYWNPGAGYSFYDDLLDAMNESIVEAAERRQQTAELLQEVMAGE